jgi:hypothetical protein
MRSRERLDQLVVDQSRATHLRRDQREHRLAVDARQWLERLGTDELEVVGLEPFGAELGKSSAARGACVPFTGADRSLDRFESTVERGRAHAIFV